MTIKLKQENYFKDRRSNIVESVLGICVGTLSDGNRLMIAGFARDSTAKGEKSIKIGDWLRSINGFDVFKDNIEEILEQVFFGLFLSFCVLNWFILA